MTIRKVGAQGEFAAKSRASRCSGTRMANVQTTDRRLRFSIVVRFNAASWRELNVIPAVKRPKRPLLERIREVFQINKDIGYSQSNANAPMRIDTASLFKKLEVSLEKG